MTTTTSPPPDRTHAQRLGALERANEIRVARSHLKIRLRTAATIRASRELAISMLEQPPWWALTMKAQDVLLATRGIGRSRADRLFIRLHVSPSKTLIGLTPRQRVTLIEGVHALPLSDGRSLTCVGCGGSFDHPRSRGRYPDHCPTCRGETRAVASTGEAS